MMNRAIDMRTEREKLDDELIRLANDFDLAPTDHPCGVTAFEVVECAAKWNMPVAAVERAALKLDAIKSARLANF